MTFDDWLQDNSDELAEQMVIPLETVFNAATKAERETIAVAAEMQAEFWKKHNQDISQAFENFAAAIREQEAGHHVES